VSRISDVANELGLQHPLSEVLANWPGDAEALLVVDALDAARKLETQAVLRGVIADVMAISSSRWRVLASVRKYDLLAMPLAQPFCHTNGLVTAGIDRRI
jgi:hypothetical protein